MEFDLIKEKPKLDIPTLNYIWDTLCRFNTCNRRKNAEQRAIYSYQIQLMEHINEIANSEKEGNKIDEE